jgi:hypothetical protein
MIWVDSLLGLRVLKALELTRCSRISRSDFGPFNVPRATQKETVVGDWPFDFEGSQFDYHRGWSQFRRALFSYVWYFRSQASRGTDYRVDWTFWFRSSIASGVPATGFVTVLAGSIAFEKCGSSNPTHATRIVGAQALPLVDAGEALREWLTLTRQ